MILHLIAWRRHMHRIGVTALGSRLTGDAHITYLRAFFAVDLAWQFKR